MERQSNLTKLILGNKNNTGLQNSKLVSGRGIFTEIKDEEGRICITFDNGDRIFRECAEDYSGTITDDHLKIECYKSMINNIMDIIYLFDGEIIVKQ